MFKRRILSVVLTAAGLLSAAEWQADVPEKGQVVLRNDSGKFVWGGRHILPMVGSGLRLRKIFPLDKLPAGTLENVRQAKLRVYCNVADFNWGGPNREVGLNEDICVVINGHRMLFKTSDPRFPQKPTKEAPQHYRWVDIPFPVAWLGKTGKLDVTMYKNTGAGGNDYFYVAADTSVPDGSSFVSTDGGRTWSRNFGCIKDGKGEFMLRLILGDSGAQPDGVPGDDFSTDRDITATRLLLQNGAERSEKVIAMPGNASNRILIPGSSGVNITGYGLTLSAVLRCRAPEKRQDRSMMFFYKPGAFFLGRTGDRFNFSLCADGKSWSQALIGGELPPLGEWFHLAAVVERVDEKAQGNVGYRLLIYLNGELYLQKFLRYVTPDRSAAQVIFGSGLKGYDFCGDVAELSCYNRSMDANEIARIAANAPRFNRLPAGMFEVPADLSGALEKLRAQASSASGRWLIDALKRSASTGADQDKLRRIAALPAARLGITAADAEAMAAAFNAAQPDYRVCVSDEAMILMTLGITALLLIPFGMFSVGLPLFRHGSVI